MVPLTILLFLVPLIRGESTVPTPTTSVIRTLIPPFGPGTANYYASILGVETDGVSYVIECAEPTTTPRATLGPSTDNSCPSWILPDGTVTFFQGPSMWNFTRVDASTNCDFRGNAGAPVCNIPSTTCGFEQFPGTAACGTGRSLMGCTAFDYSTGSNHNLLEGIWGTAVRTAEACVFGLEEKAITITAGLEKLTGSAGATTQAVSFTDIGATPTTDGPVVTVTLHKIGGNVGSSNHVSKKSILLVVMSTIALFTI